MCHMDYIEDLIEDISHILRTNMRQFEYQQYEDIGLDRRYFGRSAIHRQMLIQATASRQRQENIDEVIQFISQLPSALEFKEDV